MTFPASQASGLSPPVIGVLEPRAPAPPRAREVDPVKDFILETLQRYPRLRATRLHAMVKARGSRHSTRHFRKATDDP